jgi:hypothetical protein
MKRMAPLTIEERIEGPYRLVLLRGSADTLCLSAIQGLFGRYSKERIRLLLLICRQPSSSIALFGLL